jgi:hypothetical protein
VPSSPTFITDRAPLLRIVNRSNLVIRHQQVRLSRAWCRWPLLHRESHRFLVCFGPCLHRCHC